MTSSVIVSGARTPMGRLLGNLKNVPATTLGGYAIEAALERGGVRPDQVEYVIMGQVLQAGSGQITARQAAVAAGIPMTTPALTVNKVCLSGLDAIALADQLIRAGEFDIVVAGGMESMTNAPHLVMTQRQGTKFGDVLMRDHTAFDGLIDPWEGISMGESTERSGSRLGISRETVRYHLKGLFTKTGTHSQRGLVQFIATSLPPITLPPPQSGNGAHD